MPLTVIPTIHTILDARPLGVEIQRRWKLAHPFHCELLVRGMNDVYLVKTGDKRYAARVWRANYTARGGNDYEMEFLAFIKARGIPVAPGLPLPEGGYLITVEAPDGPRDVALFEWVEGTLLFSTADPVPAARKVGEFLGKMHVVARDFRHDPPRYGDFAEGIRDKFKFVAEIAAHKPDHVAFWRMCADRILAARAKLDRNSLPWGVTHSDLHPHNAMVHADNSVTIMDFDGCGEDFLAQELAIFPWAGRKNGFSEPAIRAFLDGYDSMRPRTDAERAAEPLFIATKEMRLLCGFAANVNAVGHAAFRHPNLDWFRTSVEKNCRAAGLI